MSSGAEDRKSTVAGGAFANQRVGTRARDPDIDDIANSFPSALGKVHHAVVFTPALPVVWVASAVAVNQNRKVATYEVLVEL